MQDTAVPMQMQAYPVTLPCSAMANSPMTWLSDHEPVSCIAGEADCGPGRSMMSALGAMRAIRTTGLKLGQDVSLIAHDDVFPYISGDHMVPTISVTRSSMRAAGVRIGEMLIDILSGDQTGWFNEVWPVELVLRDSTGPAPAQ